MASLLWLNVTYLASSFFIACLSILITITFNHYNKKDPDSKLPPTPPRLPIIGNLYQISKMPHLSFQKLAKKLGPIIHLQLGEIPTIVISSARLAKEALRINDLAISSRPHIFSAKYLFYNSTNIVFSPMNSYWREIRKICIVELLSPKRVQSYSYIREEEVSRLVHRIAESYPNTCNLTKLLGFYANDVLCRVTLGRDFSQSGENERHGFQKMLEDYQELLGGFSIGDFFPSMEFIHTLTGLKSRLEHTFKRFDQFFDEVINEHLNSCDETNPKDLVDVLLKIQQRDDAEIPLTMDNIKAIMLDMFAAGTDTSFITLDWAMTELIMNPKALKKAQTEVRSLLGERIYVSENDLPQLRYMKAIVKEVFRLHPPAPVLVPRESISDVTINGFTIPRKTRFYVNAWAIGRDPESWESPEIFKPERFMESKVDFRGSDFELIPFGAGRRICPGIAFGAATVELALAQLLHSFDWELPHGIEVKDINLTEVFGITMHRISPLLVIAKPCFL